MSLWSVLERVNWESVTAVVATVGSLIGLHRWSGKSKERAETVLTLGRRAAHVVVRLLREEKVSAADAVEVWEARLATLLAAAGVKSDRTLTGKAYGEAIHAMEEWLAYEPSQELEGVVARMERERARWMLAPKGARAAKE